MTLHSVFAAAALLYIVAGGMFFVLLARGTDELRPWATRTLGAAVVMHVAFLGVHYIGRGEPPTGSIRDLLAFASLLIVLGYLIAMRRYRLVVLGAFVTPITLLLFLGAALGHSVEHVSPDVRSVLLPIHIAVNLFGVVAFALAFTTSTGYLIQERLLRKKQVGGLFQRLPPLDVLDTLGLRLVTIGFPLLTLGIVTGAIWMLRLEGTIPAVTASQAFGVLAWIFFAAVLLLRVAAGWRGRRAAIGTMLGFACALFVLAGYVLRGGLQP